MNTYLRENKSVLNKELVIKVMVVLVFSLLLSSLFSVTTFAIDKDKNGKEFYTDYTIVGYKVKLAEKKGKTYTLTDAYTLGDVLCIRFFQTQYPFASASFNLLSIGIK